MPGKTEQGISLEGFMEGKEVKLFNRKGEKVWIEMRKGDRYVFIPHNKKPELSMIVMVNGEAIPEGIQQNQVYEDSAMTTYHDRLIMCKAPNFTVVGARSSVEATDEWFGTIGNPANYDFP